MRRSRSTGTVGLESVATPAILALALLSGSPQLADAQVSGREPVTGFSAVRLIDTPFWGRIYCNDHVWVGSDFMAVDLPARVYSRDGELVAMCGGFYSPPDSLRETCRALFEEREACPWLSRPPDARSAELLEIGRSIVRRKGGYATMMRQLLEMRLAALQHQTLSIAHEGAGDTWSPRHPLWKPYRDDVAKQLAGIRAELVDLAGGRDGISDFDETLAIAYAEGFDRSGLLELDRFYASRPGKAIADFEARANAEIARAISEAAAAGNAPGVDATASISESEFERRRHMLSRTPILFAATYDGRIHTPARQTWLKHAVAVATTKGWATIAAPLAESDADPDAAAAQSYLATTVASREAEIIAATANSAFLVPSRDPRLEHRLNAVARALLAALQRRERFRHHKNAVLGCAIETPEQQRSKFNPSLSYLLNDPVANYSAILNVADRLSWDHCVPADPGRAAEIYEDTYRAFVQHPRRAQIIGEGRALFGLAMLRATGGRSADASVRDLARAERLLVEYEKEFQYRARRSVHDSFEHWLYAYEEMSRAGMDRATCRLAEYWASGEDEAPRRIFAEYYEGKARHGCAGTPKRELNLGSNEVVLVKKRGSWYLRFGDGRPDRISNIEVVGGDDF